MSDTIYYCTKENNTCVMKNQCKRYLRSNDKSAATLFKVACTKQNNHILFIQDSTEGVKNAKETD